MRKLVWVLLYQHKEFPFTCVKDRIGACFFVRFFLVFLVSLKLKVSRFLWIFIRFSSVVEIRKGPCGSTVCLGFEALDLPGWRFFPDSRLEGAQTVGNVHDEATTCPPGVARLLPSTR